MIHKIDEFLHEFQKSKDWVESIGINFFSKKNKVYGAVDIDYQFNDKKIEVNWVLISGNKKYEGTNTIDFDGKLNSKKLKTGKFEYSIIAPLEKFSLVLKNDQLTADIKVAGVFPIYDYPENIIDDELSGKKIISNKTWNRYEQRCKINGSIVFKSGEKKGAKVNFDCFGQREHIWGIVPANNINIRSRVTVQFRDMAMILVYLEKNAVPESNGFLTKKSGNIPIINVECESLATNDDNTYLISTEFSYMDAQDDVDLLVGRSLFSVPLPLPASRKKKYFRFRNFSEFTVIGTNKKGYGVEDHYFSKEMLKLFQNAD